MIVLLQGPGFPPQTPEIEFIVAHAELLLLHVPPPVTSLKFEVNPAQIVVLPVIAAGVRLTVTVVVAVQPVPSEYVIIDDPPGAKPVTTPEDEPIGAITGLLLLHIPPAGESVNAEDVPVHIAVAPVITDGNGLTVNVVVTKQLEGNVYVIVNVPPGEKPVTTPVGEMGASNVLLLLHTPVGVASLNGEDCPTQIFVFPVIAAGIALTVTNLVMKQPVASV